MSLKRRKAMIVALAGAILLLANARAIVAWLDAMGVIDWASHLRREYLTGTAITIILVLLVLMVRSTGTGAHELGRCPVCDHPLARAGRYCGRCGSRVAVR